MNIWRKTNAKCYYYETKKDNFWYRIKIHVHPFSLYHLYTHPMWHLFILLIKKEKQQNILSPLTKKKNILSSSANVAALFSSPLFASPTISHWPSLSLTPTTVNRRPFLSWAPVLFIDHHLSSLNMETGGDNHTTTVNPKTGDGDNVGNQKFQICITLYHQFAFFPSDLL